MRRHPIRRGATNSSTIVIIVVVVLIAAVLVLGCIGMILAGILLPALGQARDSARDVMSAAQLRQINVAYVLWEREAEPDADFSFQVLVDGDYATPELFVSPAGPVPDGGEDYWILHPQPDPDPDAADRVIGYDRAMYATRQRVPVLMGDGTVEFVDVVTFEELLRAPPNDEVDFNLPPRAGP